MNGKKNKVGVVASAYVSTCHANKKKEGFKGRVGHKGGNHSYSKGGKIFLSSEETSKEES